MKVDKIYVILLDHSPEKIESIVARLEGLGIPGVPFEIVQAHNGLKDPLPEGYSAYSGWALPESKIAWWNRPLRPGEIGCSISHINVWNKVIEEGHSTVLVLEEDFKVNRSLDGLTNRELANKKLGKWDFCYLGRYSFDDGLNKNITKNLLIPGNSYTSHAYLLTGEGAKKLIKGGLHKNIIPVDEYIPAMYMDHPRPDINSMFKTELNAISTKEDWIGQTSTPQNSTIGHADQPYFEILDDSDWNAWLDKYVDPTIRLGQWDLIVDEHRDTNIFEFPLFTKKFCDEAVALSEAMDKWTVDRHDAYPTNDVLLGEIGLNDIYNRVLREIVYPLSIHLWSLEGDGYANMFSENFLARYTTDRQSHLALHHDYSHVTMVVKLNDEFDGGGTWFPKYRILSNPERVGTATLHPGLVTHHHGARPITAGKRYICVSFMRKNESNI